MSTTLEALELRVQALEAAAASEVDANSLTAKTTPASTDSMLLFGTSSNEGAMITASNYKNYVLSEWASQTYPNQVGGSAAATVPAQLATLNSKIAPTVISYTINSDVIGEHHLNLRRVGNVLFVGGYFKTKGAAVDNNTILFTLDGDNLNATFYCFVYGYDNTIKGKVEPSGNTLRASGTIQSYSGYMYFDGWLWY